MRAGVDLGGTKIEALVLEDDREVRGRARQPTPSTGGAEAVVAAVAEAVADARADAGASRLSGVGVGSPGAVDAAGGTVARAANLAGGWQDAFPLAERLSALVGAPVRVANDVAGAVGAEIELGAGRSLPSFLGVWWGTGIGGAVVLDGERWVGKGAAGELGHTVVKLGGRECECGNRGCLEAYAGRASLERRARKLHHEGRKTTLFELMKKHDRDRLTSGIWARALDVGDGLATQLIDEAYAAIAAGVASVLNLLDLDGVVLGGGLGTRFGDAAAERVGRELQAHLFLKTREPRVVAAELGDDGGAIGAALLVREGAEA
jgi:glucokinase